MAPKAAREAYLEERRQAREETEQSHAARLYRLENEFGFDLDVATDIYGMGLLESTDSSTNIISKWEELFTAATAAPGAPLVLVRIENIMRGGCHGFGQEPQYDLRVAFSGCTHFWVHDITYQAMPDQDQSKIVLRKDNIGSIYSSFEQDYSAGFTLASQLNLAALSKRHAVPVTIDAQTAVFYNPTRGDLAYYVSNQGMSRYALEAFREVDQIAEFLELPITREQD